VCAWGGGACTSAVGVVDGEHVDGDDLQHARAAQRRGAVLQQRPELLQDAGRHRREGLHAEVHTHTGTHRDLYDIAIIAFMNEIIPLCSAYRIKLSTY